MKPKSKGAGIMVSDFVDEHNGFLALTEEEHSCAKQKYPTIKRYACVYLEYGEYCEGYCNRDQMMKQMDKAVAIAEVKHPKSDGWQHVWVFDHRNCHNVMADDALDALNVNVNPGCARRKMRNTGWQGQVQKMTFNLGIPNGMRKVLEEWGVNTTGMVADQMRKILAEHDDFKK